LTFPLEPFPYEPCRFVCLSRRIYLSFKVCVDDDRGRDKKTISLSVPWMMVVALQSVSQSSEGSLAGRSCLCTPAKFHPDLKRKVFYLSVLHNPQ
jgi:hypothetical protein